MTKGIVDLPESAGTVVIEPQALLIPNVGFDTRGYRLAYGGGYSDRTLASMTPLSLKMGLAFALSRIATTYPQRHGVGVERIGVATNSTMTSASRNRARSLFSWRIATYRLTHLRSSQARKGDRRVRV